MQIPAAVDWTGQDVSLAGTPKWFAKVKEDLIRRLEALSHQIQHPYGLSPEALEGVRRQKAALEAQAQKLDKPYAIPLSITGTSEKVLFTPAELERARNDEVLARKIFESATGIPNPPRADVDEFRQRIIYQYPQLNELVDQQHQFDTQQRQERQNFAQQEMADREFIGDEANWELRNLRRAFQYKQPTGFSVYENRDKYGLNEQRAKAIDSLLEQNAKLPPDVMENLGQSIPDADKRQQLFQDINKNYPLNEYDALENLRDARPPVRPQMQYADQTNNQNDPLQQLAALQAQSLQPGGAYAGQPQQQPQVQQQATGSAPALSVDQIMANTGVKRSIAENIYNQVANKPGAILGASDNLINTGSLAPAQVKNLENLFRQPDSAPLQSGAAYAGQPQQQQQVLPDMNPYANADNGNMLPKENLSPEEALLNRASIPLKKARLGEQHGRVAPMHPLAEQAQRMMQRNIDSDQPAFEHAQSQLEEAQRLNLPREIRGHLQSGLTPTYQLSDPYMNKYNKDVIDALRQEAQTNFLEDIMPHVKGQYAATGAYHSGARQNELNRFAQKTQQQLNRDIAKLLHQGHEGAMNRAGEQNERQMQAAQIAGNAAKAQQEAHVRNAEARRNLGLIQKESKKHDIAAVSQFATQHQQQLQNEMNAKQLAYLESKMEPHIRLGRYADTVAGIPSSSSMQVNAHRGPAPNPPSPYNVVPGLLGQVFGLQNQPAPFKKGGSVNNKYAPGGLVEKALHEYKQFADHVQPEKYDQEIQDLTTGFRNYKIDPIQNWVQHVSAQMLANNREDPLSNLGRGAIVAEENMMKHRDSMLASREKAANLYGAMNESRRNQQQLIGDYTQKYAANSESRRHNSAMEALKKEENEIKRLKNSATNALGTSINPSTGKFFMSKEQEKQYYKREAAAEDELDKGKTEYKELSDRFNLIKNASENMGPTGAIWDGLLLGATYNSLPNSLATAGTLFDGGSEARKEQIANRRLFEQQVTKELSDILNKLKGTQSDKDMATFKLSQISLADEPETIKKTLEKQQKLLDRHKEALDYIDRRVQEGVPLLDAKKEWHAYANAHPLFAQSELDSEEAKLDKQIEEAERKAKIGMAGAMG